MMSKVSAYAKILTEMSPYLDEVEEALTSHLRTSSELVETINRYIIDCGGKRLRPLLMIICARLCGYQGRDFARLATCIEYLHSATLLHDDVIDGARTRRGNPSANHRWGSAAAVLSGDVLFSQAFAILVESYSKEITLTMLGAAIDMINGEVLELTGRRRADLGEDGYLETIRLKTASLIAASCRAGALLGGGNPDRVEALTRFGGSLGMAFQIIDDVLDYTGEERKFGKTPGGDLREGVVTLPLLKLRGKLTETERAWLLGAITEEAGPAQISRAISLIREYRADRESYEAANLFVDDARAALEGFGKNVYRSMLDTAADYVVSRQI